MIITFSKTVSSQEISVIDNKGTIQKVNNNSVTSSQITFVSHVNVESFNLDTDNGIDNNNTRIVNSFGTMNSLRDNGNDVDKTTASLASFNANGLSINVSSRANNANSDNLVVLHTAYK